MVKSEAEQATQVAIRAETLNAAKRFIDPIVEKFPPEDYRVTTGPGQIYTQAPGTTMTAAETVLELCFRAADWLLDDQD